MVMVAAVLFMQEVLNSAVKWLQHLTFLCFPGKGDHNINSATSRRIYDEKDELCSSGTANIVGKRRRVYALEGTASPLSRQQGTDITGQNRKRSRYQNVSREQDTESKHLFDNFLESFFKP